MNNTSEKSSAFGSSLARMSLEIRKVNNQKELPGVYDKHLQLKSMPKSEFNIHLTTPQKGDDLTLEAKGGLYNY